MISSGSYLSQDHGTCTAAYLVSLVLSICETHFQLLALSASDKLIPSWPVPTHCSVTVLSSVL